MLKLVDVKDDMHISILNTKTNKVDVLTMKNYLCYVRKIEVCWGRHLHN